MPKKISKQLTVTRVSFKTISVKDGNASFVDEPCAVFSGSLDLARVNRLLRDRLGKDVTFVVTDVDAGQHRFEMSLEQFVLNSTVADDGMGADDCDDDEENDGVDEGLSANDELPASGEAETPADVPNLPTATPPAEAQPIPSEASQVGPAATAAAAFAAPVVQPDAAEGAVAVPNESDAELPLH